MNVNKSQDGHSSPFWRENLLGLLFAMAIQDRENFFQSLNWILDDAECAIEQQLVKVSGLCLENAVGVLQQVVLLVPGETKSEQVLMGLLRNF